jgi:hypothetical protein
MTITVYRCIHTPSDVNEILKRCVYDNDIIVMEHSSNDDRSSAKEAYKKLSKTGEKPDFQMNFNGFGNSLFGMLGGSGKSIEVENSPICEDDWLKVDMMRQECDDLFVNGQFQQLHDKYVNARTLNDKFQKMRDDALSAQLIEMQNENKGYKILPIIGVDHEIVNRIKTKQPDVKQVLSRKTITLSTEEELEKKIRHSIPYIREEVFRSYLENPLMDYLSYSKKEKDHHKLISMGREILNGISMEDIKSISRNLQGKDDLWVMNPQHAIGEWLKKNGKV